MLQQRSDNTLVYSLIGSIALHLAIVLFFNSNGDTVDKQTRNDVQYISVTLKSNSTPATDVPSIIPVKIPKKVSQPSKPSPPNSNKPTWISEIDDFIFTHGSIQQIEEETRFYSCPRRNLSYTSFGS